MELIKELPDFNKATIVKPEDENKLVVAKIFHFDCFNNIFLCYLNDLGQVGYLSLDDYSIYPLKNPFDEINKIIYAYVEKFDEKYGMLKLLRKDLLEKQSIAAMYDDTVYAKITAFYNEELAFCEFGAGLRGNVSLAKYLYIRKAVNSIADILQIGSIFKAKIDTEYKENLFSLTTFKVEDYNFNLEVDDIVSGRVFARLEDDDHYRYSYWFMLTPRVIGIIKSDRPLGYGQSIKAKVHCINDNFIKFRFESYIN